MAEARIDDLPSSKRLLNLRAAMPARLTVVRLVQALIVLAYLALMTALLLHRDAWLDEAQAWSWAIHLSSPADFFVIPGEGHPPVWFWLLRLISHVLSFEQARVLTLGIATVNALLLVRLFGSNLVLLTLILFSNVVLHTWGYHFRPYSLVLALTLTTVLLARQGRLVAGAWVMAFACGLHFFAGFLFALYLLTAWRRGLSLRASLLPMALGLLFGASAVLSGLGNPVGEITFVGFPVKFLNVLATPFWMGAYPDWLMASAAVLLTVYGLRKAPDVLAALAVAAVLFASFASAVYAPSEWHMAFLITFLIMSFGLAGAQATRWTFIVLLIPQFLYCVIRTNLELSNPPYDGNVAMAAIRADAGPGFDPATQLVSWPDTLMVAPSVRDGFAFIGASGQRHPQPMDWRKRRYDSLDTEVLATTPTPYWLACHYCASALVTLASAGRGAELVLAPPSPDMFKPIWVYKVTTPQR